MSEKIDISNMFQFKELTDLELEILKNSLKIYRPYVEFELNALSGKKAPGNQVVEGYITVKEKQASLNEILEKIDYLLQYL